MDYIGEAETAFLRDVAGSCKKLRDIVWGTPAMWERVYLGSGTVSTVIMAPLNSVRTLVVHIDQVCRERMLRDVQAAIMLQCDSLERFYLSLGANVLGTLLPEAFTFHIIIMLRICRNLNFASCTGFHAPPSMTCLSLPAMDLTACYDLIPASPEPDFRAPAIWGPRFSSLSTTLQHLTLPLASYARAPHILPNLLTLKLAACSDTAAYLDYTDELGAQPGLFIHLPSMPKLISFRADAIPLDNNDFDNHVCLELRASDLTKPTFPCLERLEIGPYLNTTGEHAMILSQCQSLTFVKTPRCPLGLWPGVHTMALRWTFALGPRPHLRHLLVWDALVIADMLDALETLVMPPRQLLDAHVFYMLQQHCPRLKTVFCSMVHLRPRLLPLPFDVVDLPHFYSFDSACDWFAGQVDA